MFHTNHVFTASLLLRLTATVWMRSLPRISVKVARKSNTPLHSMNKHIRRPWEGVNWVRKCIHYGVTVPLPELCTVPSVTKYNGKFRTFSQKSPKIGIPRAKVLHKNSFLCNIQSLELFPRNLSVDFFLKIGILSLKVQKSSPTLKNATSSMSRSNFWLTCKSL